jgi:phosphoribosylanthranilate isomerase
MTGIRVKICGVTTLEDARYAAELGADMLGFNFYRKSPRYITPQDARTICAALRSDFGDRCPLLVGVFVNELVSTVAEFIEKAGLHAAQLSGDESVEMLTELRGKAFKSIRPMNREQALDDVRYYAPRFPVDERFPSLLLDAYHPELYGGTGEQAADDVIAAVKELAPRLMLAGGLTPENVAERVRAVQPWGVDIASGVEPEGQPGVKDAAKVRAFIEAARGQSYG